MNKREATGGRWVPVCGLIEAMTVHSRAAKVGLGVILSDIRGKVGGGVFSRAHSGATLRTRVTPHNPNTAAQSAVRNALTVCSRAFKALSAVNAAAWNAYGESLTFTNPVSGGSYHPSGITIFNKLNTKVIQITPGASPVATPPATAYAGDTVTVTSADSVGDITFTGSGANAAGSTTEVLYQKLPSANVKPDPEGYISGGFKVMAAMSLTKVTPALVPGIYATAYRMCRIADGQCTGIVVIPALVTVT